MKKPRPKTWPKMAKAKGREAENAVCAYLQSRGIPAERRRLAGVADCGDIATDIATIEVKNCRKIDLAGWLDEANVEGDNADARMGLNHVQRPRLVIAKRKGETNPAKWYAIMEAEQAVGLLIYVARNTGLMRAAIPTEPAEEMTT